MVLSTNDYQRTRATDASETYAYGTNEKNNTQKRRN